ASRFRQTTSAARVMAIGMYLRCNHGRSPSAPVSNESAACQRSRAPLQRATAHATTTSANGSGKTTNELFRIGGERNAASTTIVPLLVPACESAVTVTAAARLTSAMIAIEMRE